MARVATIDRRERYKDTTTAVPTCLDISTSSFRRGSGRSSPPKTSVKTRDRHRKGTSELARAPPKTDAPRNSAKAWENFRKLRMSKATKSSSHISDVISTDEGVVRKQCQRNSSLSSLLQSSLSSSQSPSQRPLTQYERRQYMKKVQHARHKVQKSRVRELELEKERALQNELEKKRAFHERLSRLNIEVGQESDESRQSSITPMGRKMAAQGQEFFQKFAKPPEHDLANEKKNTLPSKGRRFLRHLESLHSPDPPIISKQCDPPSIPPDPSPMSPQRRKLVRKLRDAEDGVGGGKRIPSEYKGKYLSKLRNGDVEDADINDAIEDREAKVCSAGSSMHLREITLSSRLERLPTRPNLVNTSHANKFAQINNLERRRRENQQHKYMKMEQGTAQITGVSLDEKIRWEKQIDLNKKVVEQFENHRFHKAGKSLISLRQRQKYLTELIKTRKETDRSRRGLQARDQFVQALPHPVFDEGKRILSKINGPLRTNALVTSPSGLWNQSHRTMRQLSQRSDTSANPGAVGDDTSRRRLSEERSKALKNYVTAKRRKSKVDQTENSMEPPKDEEVIETKISPCKSGENALKFEASSFLKSASERVSVAFAWLAAQNDEAAQKTNIQTDDRLNSDHRTTDKCGSFDKEGDGKDSKFRNLITGRSGEELIPLETVEKIIEIEQKALEEIKRQVRMPLPSNTFGKVPDEIIGIEQNKLKRVERETTTPTASDGNRISPEDINEEKQNTSQQIKQQATSPNRNRKSSEETIAVKQITSQQIKQQATASNRNRKSTEETTAVKQNTSQQVKQQATSHKACNRSIISPEDIVEVKQNIPDQDKQELTTPTAPSRNRTSPDDIIKKKENTPKQVHREATPPAAPKSNRIGPEDIIEAEENILEQVEREATSPAAPNGNIIFPKHSIEGEQKNNQEMTTTPAPDTTDKEYPSMYHHRTKIVTFGDDSIIKLKQSSESTESKESLTFEMLRIGGMQLLHQFTSRFFRGDNDSEYSESTFTSRGDNSDESSVGLNP